MTEETAKSSKGKRFGYLALLLVLLLGILGGGLAVAGIVKHRLHAMGPGHGWGGHHWMRDRGPGDAYGPQRIERMVRFAARRLDATDEQKQRLQEIVRTTMADMKPLRGKMREARRQAQKILTAPTIDRAALETLRAAQVAEADAASRRLSQALADVAEVLTPEQRARIADRFDF